MDISKAFEANNYVEEIKKLDKKIYWVEKFISETVNFSGKGELRFVTFDNKIYNILLEEQSEVDEISAIILDYYHKKRKLIMETIEEL